jgi:foldase protein PrsA
VYLEKITTSYHPKEEYKNILLMQTFGESEKLKTWLDEVKKSYQIEITDPAFKAYRLFTSNDLKGAAENYEAAFKKYEYETFLQKASECYKKLGNWDKVLELNDEGIDINPDNVQYYISKAEALHNKQQTDKAKDFMKKQKKGCRQCIFQTACGFKCIRISVIKKTLTGLRKKYPLSKKKQ